MKGGYFFLMILGFSLVEGATIKKEAKLSAPRVRKTWTFDPAGIRIQWEPVEGLKDDPIVGYRMKVWEMTKRVFVDEGVNGESKLVEKIEPIKDIWSFDFTSVAPTWIKEVGPEATKAEVNDVKLDVSYELRVQAFTKNEEGPFSDPIGVSISGSKES